MIPDHFWDLWRSPESFAAMMVTARRVADKDLSFIQKAIIAAIPTGIGLVVAVVGSAAGTMYVLNDHIYRLEVQQEAINRELTSLVKMIDYRASELSKRADRNEQRIDRLADESKSRKDGNVKN